MIKLTEKQQEGLDIALLRYKQGKQYTVISGYAGTGKSTLVRFIIDELGINEDKVCYCAYTGKATEVLRKKGNKNTLTLHRLLYDSVPRPDGTFLRRPKPAIKYRVVVVDEVSMVPKSLVNLLFIHKAYIIFLGDPFQLPPINKDEDNHLLDSPHIFLDKIVRQAESSEIIQLSMKIRNYEPLDYMTGENVMIVPKESLSTGMLTWADQVLVGTNNMRSKINTLLRNENGYSGPPKDGEKIICLRNYWDFCNQEGDSLINGTIGTLINSYDTFYRIPYFISTPVRRINFIKGDFAPLDSEQDSFLFKKISIDKNLIETGKRCLDNKLLYQLNGLKRKIGDVIPKEFDFAYAITVHRAQGSEWEKVLVIEEKFPYNREEHARWLYTAITRASSRLVLVR